MCPSGQIKITVQCRWKHMQSVWSSLCLWSSSCLLMTNKSLSRPFTSLRSCQVFWGRSSLQILLTSSDTNLKTYCYPLSGFLFQYMCDVLPRVKDWYRWHASTLLPLCQCQGSVFFFLVSLLIFWFLALCFGYQNHLPQFCWWKQCPGKSVHYHPDALLSLPSVFILPLTYTGFHSYFLPTKLSISCEFLHCK